MRTTLFTISALTILLGRSALYGQDPKTALQQKLEQTYPITHATGDNTDILVPGVILVLKKDRLPLSAIDSGEKIGSSYKDGRIVPGFFASATDAPKRVFMTTEKLWLTDIEIKRDGVVFTFLTDAFANVRYTGSLKFPFSKSGAKGEVPSFDEVNSSITQVFDTEFLPAAGARRTRSSRNSVPAPEAPAPVQAPAPAPTPIPPPPPPPADPATTPPLLGKTTAQVVDALGQPTKIIKLSAVKQIYVYKDLKVVFISGKVTDIQ